MERFDQKFVMKILLLDGSFVLFNHLVDRVSFVDFVKVYHLV